MASSNCGCNCSREELTQFSILFPKKHYRNRNSAVKFHRSKVFKCMFNFGMLIVETIFKM